MGFIRRLAELSYQPVGWLRAAITDSGREREGVIQAAKMAGAAVVSWLIAREIGPSQSFIAPYAAVFLMSETVLRSLLGVAQQLSALVLGVLLAFVSIKVTGEPVLAMGLAVFLGMLIGQWHQFGGSGVWIGITALLMLGYGTADQQGFLLLRVGESAIGAGIGAAVNIFVLPPVHLRDTQYAARELSREVGSLVRGFAESIRADLSRYDPRSWLRRARAMQFSVRKADDAARRAREGARFNPRWHLPRRHVRSTSPARYLAAIGALQVIVDQVQRMAEALAWLQRMQDTDAPLESPFKERFAGALDDLAAAIDGYERLPVLDSGSLDRRLAALLGWIRDERVALGERSQRDSGDGIIGVRGVETTLLLALEQAGHAISDDYARRDNQSVER
ncbi:hypothetical protein BAY61_18290 [Prauserella marina]|uniref:FUSC family protein n=1 Tax=Prauserella marina TaxID=530584 RepID=UPI000B834A22|nr:FUSC family protein [Prauserella marina]ASR36626.1 hypothetical protein BAY61_18290 [Prauserella marina]